MLSKEHKTLAEDFNESRMYISDHDIQAINEWNTELRQTVSRLFETVDNFDWITFYVIAGKYHQLTDPEILKD